MLACFVRAASPHSSFFKSLAIALPRGCIMSNSSDTRIKRVKTGKFERRLSMASAGMVAGTRAATQMWTNWWLPKAEREVAQKQVMADTAQYLADELGKLKGSVVKVGQMMASFGEHVLPPEVTLALRSMEEKTIAVDWPVMEQMLVSELGKGVLDELDIDPNPLGAASLAQVHRAVRRADGAQLALKIQYPGVQDAIDSDLNDITQLLRLTQLVNMGQGFNEWLEEIRRLLRREVDYVEEAKTIARFAQRLAGDPVLCVPELFAEYCSSRVLAMSYEAGDAVNSVQVASLSQQTRDELGERYLQLFFQELFDWGELQTDPNFGNYRIRATVDGHRLVLLDFGAVLPFDTAFLDPFKRMIQGAYHCDEQAVLEGAWTLRMIRPDHAEKVQHDFVSLCMQLLEPLNFHEQGLQAPWITDEGRYVWSQSQLPRRVAKFAAKSAFSLNFSMPPKEFAFISRKMLGVFNVIAALDARFASPQWLEQYL